MAAKIRGLGRLLVALTLMGWGHLAFAEDYYWVIGSATSPRYPSAQAAFSALESSSSTVRHEIYNQSEASWSYRSYRISDGGYLGFGSINRRGSGCTSPAVYNPTTGGCETPKDCASTSGQQITAAQECTYNASLKTYICPDQIQQDGCLYTGGPNRKCVADLTGGKAICTGDFYGSGQPAGEGPDSCTEESCTPPRDPTSEIGRAHV